MSSTNVDALVSAGFKTFGQYAFSVPYQPGSADESPLVDLLTATLSGEPPASQLSCLRRLFWESHGLVVRGLRLRQEHGSDTVIKKLPTSERVARAEAQKSRLTGITWSPETEPSHQLVDRFVTMLEEQAVTYIRPELCTSRAQETLQVKQTKTFSLGSDGQLRLATKGDDLECSTAGEWRLRMALQRKSLAMDLAGLVSYQVAETWHTYLYTVREREVPKNTKQVSLQQILDADKRLWILLSEEVRGKIVAAPSSAPTCDAVILRLSSSSDVLSYLVPQPECRGPSQPRWEPYTSSGVKGKGKGKGKERNKGKASEATSIILFDSVATSMHTDALNAPCDNLVIGLSRFEGGDLWTEWPASAPRDPRLKYETRSFDSRSTLGALLPVSKHPVLFCAKSLKHETCPFRGRRVVLVFRPLIK